MNKDSLQPDSADGFDEKVASAFWKDVGVPEPLKYDDRFAPKVDHDYLRRLARKELPKDVARGAYMLIHAFDSWKRAYAEIVIQEFHNRQPPSASLSC